MGQFLNALSADLIEIGADTTVLVGVPPATPGKLDLSDLNPAEFARMDRFLHTADRDAYAMAHITARRALGAKLHMKPALIVFERDTCSNCGDSAGRPYVAGRRDVYFSIAHARGAVAVAISNRPIGIDIEPAAEHATALLLAEKLHENERQLLVDVHASDLAHEFTKVWVRKEANLKRIGSGLCRSLSFDDTTSPGPGWSYRDLPAPTGFAASCAWDDERPVAAEGRMAP